MTGRTSALDVLAPAPAATDAAEPDDVLSELLAFDPAVGLAPEDENDILLLARLKQEKTAAEKRAKGLTKDIERIQTRLIETAVEEGLLDKRGRIDYGAVDDGKGFTVKPYEVHKVWPKYRVNPDTDQPYEREHLIPALRAAGLGHLVVETTEQYDYPGYVRDRVTEWRQAAGAAGVRDPQGRFVDLDGELLDAEEAKDPTADIYALPRALRAVIEPVTKVDIQFTRRKIAEPAAAQD